MMERIISLFLSASLILASCAPMNSQDSQSAAMGAAGGALVGALLGQAIGGDTKSTLIGAAAGGLLGALVVTGIQKNTRKVSGGAATKNEYNYHQGEGFILKNGGGFVSPKKVTRGDTVQVNSSYIVMGAPTSDVTVREVLTLWHNGQLKSTLCDEAVIRDDGTWDIDLSFTLPDTAQAGNYVIQRDIYYKGTVISQKYNFTVV